MFLTEDKEVVETLHLQRLDEPLHEGVGVRRPERQSARVDASRFENLIEPTVEIVIIATDRLQRQLMLLGVVKELDRLLSDPRRGRLYGARRDVDPPGGHMNKHHGKDLWHTELGKDPLREEVALPQSLRVH